jgi:hypothetical protein
MKRSLVARPGGDKARSIIEGVGLTAAVVSLLVKYDDVLVLCVLPVAEAAKVDEEAGAGVSAARAGIRRRQGSRSSSSFM